MKNFTNFKKMQKISWLLNFAEGKKLLPHTREYCTLEVRISQSTTE